MFVPFRRTGLALLEEVGPWDLAAQPSHLGRGFHAKHRLVGADQLGCQLLHLALLAR